MKLKQEAGPGHGGTELEGYWISGRVDDPVIELNAKYWGIAEVESHVVRMCMTIYRDIIINIHVISSKV